MSIRFFHSRGNDKPISIQTIGLKLHVRIPGSATDGAFSAIETINAPGKGPPRHKHPEAEIFRVLEGRYLYEVDGLRFYVEKGDVVSIPGGLEHAFINTGDTPARQYIMITPALDAVAFFTGLAAIMDNGVPASEALNRFGQKWQVEFLGPPLNATDKA